MYPSAIATEITLSLIIDTDIEKNERRTGTHAQSVLTFIRCLEFIFTTLQSSKQAFFVTGKLINSFYQHLPLYREAVTRIVCQ